MKDVGKFFLFGLQTSISLAPYIVIFTLSNNLLNSFSFLTTTLLIFNVIIYLSFLFYESTIFHMLRLKSIKRITSKLIFAGTSMMIVQSILWSAGLESMYLEVLAGVLYFGLMFSALFTLTLPEDQTD